MGLFNFLFRRKDTFTRKVRLFGRDGALVTEFRGQSAPDESFTSFADRTQPGIVEDYYVWKDPAHFAVRIPSQDERG